MNASISKKIEQIQSLSAYCGVIFFVQGVILFVIIYSWNDFHKLEVSDALTISISALQTFLVVAAFGGFWMLKNTARDRAEEVAKECAERYVNENFEPMVRRAAEEYLAEIGDSLSDTEINAIMGSIGANGDE